MPHIVPPVELRENLYADIILPLVWAYNYTDKRLTPNPHEVLWAATLLNARTDWWGTNMPSSTDSVRGNTGSSARRGDPECCLEPRIPMCCKQTLVAGAIADRAASPDTQRTRTLEKQLRTMEMSQPNAWQDWIAATDYFFNNCVQHLLYFTYKYKTGNFADFYEQTAGLFMHPDSYRSGIQMERLQEGSDGADKAVTTITVDIALAPDAGTYFEVYSDATNRWIIWHDVDFSGIGAPDVAPIGGVTDHYLKIDLDSSLTPADAALAYRTQLFLAVGWAFEPPTTGGVSDVIITTLTTGSKPPSDFANLPAHDTWGGVFVDGDDDAAAAAVKDCWQLWCVPLDLTQLADRFAVMYDTAGASWLFYYDLDGAGTFVPPVGLIPDNSVAIAITTGMDRDAVTVATGAAIDSAGFATTAIMPSPRGGNTMLEITYNIDAPATYFDKGTLTFGVNYKYNQELRGSDASVLTTGITSPEEYATAWNDIKVPYEATLGNTYPYLNPNAPWIGHIYRRHAPCPDCLGSPGRCWQGDQSGCDICTSCTDITSSAAFRTSAYNGYNIANYNTPGNLFVASDGRQANLTPISELI